MSESIKNDRKDGKVMMELLPWRELEEIAKVFTAGAKKYGANRWQNLPDGYERYKGAMLRHISEVEKGNIIDEDTGCMHAAQIAWNAIAMLHFKMNEREAIKCDEVKEEPNVMVLSPEEKEESHESFDRKIGEVFEFGSVKLKVQESTLSCVGCFFLENMMSCLGKTGKKIGNCFDEERKDNKRVIFVKEE